MRRLELGFPVDLRGWGHPFGIFKAGKVARLTAEEIRAGILG